MLSDNQLFLKVVSDQYQVFLQIDGVQEVEILETSKTFDAVQGQVENLQPLQILQPFDPLQLVPPLDTDRGRGHILRGQYVIFMNMHAAPPGIHSAIIPDKY